MTRAQADIKARAMGHEPGVWRRCQVIGKGPGVVARCQHRPCDELLILTDAGEFTGSGSFRECDYAPCDPTGLPSFEQIIVSEPALLDLFG